MVENARLPARSNNGCWTCRLRRKKCDEVRPFCTPCVSLDLECHGYGPRPAWMDNGILQRMQAARFKRLVSQGTSKKGRRQQLPTRQPSLASPGGIYSFSTDSVSPTIDPSFVTVDPRFRLELQEELQPQGQQSAGYGSLSMADHMFSLGAPSPNSFVHQLGTALQDGFGTQDSTWDPSLLRLTDHLNATCSIPPDQVSQHLGTLAHLDKANGLEHEHCIDPDWPASDGSSMQACFGREYFNDTPLTSQHQQQSHHPASVGSSRTSLVSTSDSPIPRKTAVSRDGFWTHTDIDERLCLTLNGARCDSVASPSQGLISNGNTEDTLFMHYLDQVFYVQYPFDRFQSRQGRGWVLAILRRTKSAYHAALALSERHLLPKLLDKDDITNGLIQLRTQHGHYDLAIQKLHTMILESYTFNGPAAVKPSLEILMTLLQLFFFEIFNGGREKWHAHLRTASRFIPLLLEERMAKTSSSSPGSNYSSERPETIPFCPEVESALKFLIGSFIVFDITASASTRSAPSLPINHVKVINDLGISLEPLVGFQNSVMALLLEVVTLDKWKNEAQSTNKLSIVDLAKRGAEIQERLRQELATTEKASLEQSSYGLLVGSTQPPSYPVINKIFILAATTYLHVVVSGPYPAVPEIANSVAETIAAFKSLQDSSLLRYLVWPLCVSGCLALEQHYDFFRNLMARERITPLSTGTCFEAFSIMQECWKARITSDATCDWAAAMKKRGCYVYLG